MIVKMNNSENSKITNFQIFNSQAGMEANSIDQNIVKINSLKTKADFTFHVSLSINSKQIQEVFFQIANKRYVQLKYFYVLKDIHLKISIEKQYLKQENLSCSLKSIQLFYTRGFQVLESGTDEGIVIKQEKRSCFSLICESIFKRSVNKESNSENIPSMIRIKIENDTRKCLKIVKVQRLSGVQSQSDGLIQNFQKQIEKMVTKNGNNQDEEIVFDAAFTNDQKDKVDILLIGQSKTQITSESPFELETTSYYMFYRILSADNYGIGKKVYDFVEAFKKIFLKVCKNTKNIDPIESISIFINEIVGDLFNEFNYGKDDTKKLMPFCRIAVETYIYSKLYKVIFDKYKLSICSKQDKLNSVLKKIHEKYPTLEKLLEKPEYKKYAHIDISQIVFNLDQLNVTMSPSESIKYICMCFHQIKIALMEKQKGKLDFHQLKSEQLKLQKYRQKTR